MSELAKKTAGAAGWSVLEIAARYGVQFIVTAILARLLTPTDFGVISLVLVFTSFANVLIDSGFGIALIQKRFPSPDDETTVAAYAIATSFGAFATLYTFAPAIAHFFARDELTDLLRASAWVMPLTALGIVPDARLTITLGFRERTAAQLLASVLSGGVGVLMALRGAGAWSLVAQLLVAAGSRSVGVWVLSGWRPRGRISAQSFRSLSGFGSYMLISGIIDTALTRIQPIILARMTDVGTLGYYSLAQNAQQVPAMLIGSVLNRVGLPVFSQIADDSERMRSALASALRVSMFLFVPTMFGIAFSARPLVRLLYGDSWLPAAPLLSVMAIGTVWWPMHVLNLAAISAHGRSDLFLRLEVIKASVLLILLIAAASHGAMAIAIATAAASLIAVAINTWYSRNLFSYSARAQLKDIRGIFVLAGVSAIPAIAIAIVLPESIITSFLALFVAGTIYIGGAHFSRMRAWSELLLVTKRALGMREEA